MKHETDASSLPLSPPCWQTIGVWSNDRASCPELNKYVHCRNCPIFSRQGRALFFREIPSDYRKEWTAQMEQAKKCEEIGQEFLSCFIFRLGREWFALPAQVLKEIVEMQPIHRVPHKSNAVLLGVTAISGQIQPCISLEGVLQLPLPSSEEEKGISRRSHFVVVKDDSQLWVFPTEEIGSIHPLLHSSIKPSPLPDDAVSLLQGMFFWGNDDVALIDPKALFSTLRDRVVSP